MASRVSIEKARLRRAFSVIRLHRRFAVTATTLVAGRVIEFLGLPSGAHG